MVAFAICLVLNTITCILRAHGPKSEYFRSIHTIYSTIFIPRFIAVDYCVRAFYVIHFTPRIRYATQVEQNRGGRGEEWGEDGVRNGVRRAGVPCSPCEGRIRYAL